MIINHDQVIVIQDEFKCDKFNVIPYIPGPKIPKISNIAKGIPINGMIHG